MQHHTVITHAMPSHRTATPEDMDRFAIFLEANPFASAMMIHQGPHGEQRGVAGGTKVSGSYFGARLDGSQRVTAAARISNIKGFQSGRLPRRGVSCEGVCGLPGFRPGSGQQRDGGTKGTRSAKPAPSPIRAILCFMFVLVFRVRLRQAPTDFSEARPSVPSSLRSATVSTARSDSFASTLSQQPQHEPAARPVCFDALIFGQKLYSGHKNIPAFSFVAAVDSALS